MKPPYRVPLLAEIAAPAVDAPTVVSTFSGAGGSCLGFRLAGYRVLYASEFVPAARETYAANFPETPLDERDIRDVEPAEILDRIGRARGEIDVLEGSPPCAAFSMAGKRARSWNAVKPYSDTAQRTDDLFFEYARLLAGLAPRVFVAENVAGLARGVAKGYFKRIYRELEAAGYVVGARLLDAQWLGVPQARARIIFVGIRADLAERYGVGPAFPKPLAYRYSIRDALPELLAVDGGNGAARDGKTASYAVDSPLPSVLAGGARYSGRTDQFWVQTKRGARSLDETAPTVLTHGRAYTTSELTLAVGDGPSLDGYAIGAEYDRLRPGETSDRYFNLSRPDPDAPCLTITQRGGGHPSVASVTHPYERRKFTIAELRRICGFPDDFVLTGTYAQQWERLGRAVPPPMMRAVAATVRDEILERLS